MTAAAKEKREVTLPEGVSLRRVAEVLLDAWEADPRRWMNAASRLREGPSQPSSMPVPQDALDLFRLLAERRVEYLLVGGLAMLTYIKGRNTKDVDLLMSVGALEKLPELAVEDRNDFFARGKFKSVQVDLLLTINPLFKIVAERFATKHSFEELTVPTATVEGMILLKLFALPSLFWPSVSSYSSFSAPGFTHRAHTLSESISTTAGKHLRIPQKQPVFSHFGPVNHRSKSSPPYSESCGSSPNATSFNRCSRARGSRTDFSKASKKLR